MRRMSFNSESGVVLLMVIIFMIVLTIVGLALLHATVLEHKLTTREVYRNQAFFLADAGIDHLTYKLYHWEQPTLIDWTPLGDGQYQVVADYGEGSAISTGQRLKGAEVKVEQKIRVTIGSEGIFFYAVFADESITMTGLSFVDGDIGTNSIDDNAITLTPDTAVNGNAVVGPGGDPSEVISGEENISGSLGALSQERPMVPYPLPSPMPPDWGSLSVSGGGTETISGDRWYPGGITVNGDLIIDGPSTLVISRLRVHGGPDSKITITNVDPNADESVILYITDEADIAGGGIVNESGDPRALWIYGTETCSSISFSGSRDLVAAVYAPEADISCTGDALIIGSLVGNTIDINGNPEVIYDENLGGPSEPSFFVLRDWQQVF